VSGYSLTKSLRLALAVGKVSAWTIQRFGMGMGSNFPGRLARYLYPKILSELSSQPQLGALAVTGTNGKSTTAGLISSILKIAGYKLVHNRQGANLATGITASLIDAANWQGRVIADYALFEIDEAALAVVAEEIKLKAIIVTNLFRDQLDRFGELDTTARLIAKGIMENKSTAVLNADDPNVSQLVWHEPRVYFGVEAATKADPTGNQTLAELSYCAKCGHDITYKTITYGQLGNWSCSQCQHSRPPLDFFASDVNLARASSTFVLHYGNNSEEVDLPLPGLFNVYNAVAAGATACLLGVSLETIKEGLKDYTTLFGRSEYLSVFGRSVLVQLIKNPAGATQTIKAANTGDKINVLIAINDNLADGRDVSWLWDAEFEPLVNVNGLFIVSGQRAEDMAVRLKYAGVEPAKIECIPSLERALSESLNRTKPGSLLWILPTYTCLLRLQKIFQKYGLRLSGT